MARLEKRMQDALAGNEREVKQRTGFVSGGFDSYQKKKLRSFVPSLKSKK